MAEVRDQVVYQLRLIASDAASGKPITNTIYTKCTQGSGVYGTDIPGTSDATLYDSMWTLWLNNVLPLLHENYTMVKYIGNSIVGRRWPTPIIPIVGTTPTLTNTIVITGVPHGLSSGDTVEISGMVTPPPLNSIWNNITVISPTSFSIDVITTVAGGGAQVQKIAGVQEFVYDQNVEMTYNNTGGIATSEALPLVCTASWRRTNSGVGRNFRSRLSIGIIAEGSQKDGALTTAARGAFNTAGGLMPGPYDCGGGKDAFAVAVSKNIALLGPTTFVQSLNWAKFTGNWIVQPNLGSLTKRKPRLTSAIV